jgi:hypothetical protein
MRVLGSGDVSPADLNELDFDADGEHPGALNEAFIKLQDIPCDLRRNDPELDRAMRAHSLS